MTESQRKAAKAFDAFAATYNHESVEWLDMGADATFIAGYLAALAEPAPEPIGQFMQALDIHGNACWVQVDADLNVGQPLYAAPVREQAPVPLLTDDEISDIAIANPPDVHTFARAIEALYRQKAGL